MERGFLLSNRLRDLSVHHFYKKRGRKISQESLLVRYVSLHILIVCFVPISEAGFSNLQCFG